MTAKRRIDRTEPVVDWSVDARTVHHVHRQSELATALSEVRGDVALLAGLDPRWSRVNEALERGVDHDEALEQLLTGPLGKLVLDGLKKRVDEERTPARAWMRVEHGSPAGLEHGLPAGLEEGAASDRLEHRARSEELEPRTDPTDEAIYVEHAPLPLAIPVRRRFPLGVAAVAIATFVLAIAVGYGIGTLGAEDEGTITPSVANAPRTYPLPRE